MSDFFLSYLITAVYNYRNIICIDRNDDCYDLAHLDIECSANISLEPNRIGILQESSKFQIIDLLSEDNAVIDHNILNFSINFGSFPIFCGTEVGLETGKYCLVHYNFRFLYFGQNDEKLSCTIFA